MEAWATSPFHDPSLVELRDVFYGSGITGNALRFIHRRFDLGCSVLWDDARTTAIFDSDRDYLPVAALLGPKQRHNLAAAVSIFSRNAVAKYFSLEGLLPSSFCGATHSSSDATSAGRLTRRNSDAYAFFVGFDACDHLSAASNTSATEFTVPYYR